MFKLLISFTPTKNIVTRTLSVGLLPSRKLGYVCRLHNRGVLPSNVHTSQCNVHIGSNVYAETKSSTPSKVHRLPTDVGKIQRKLQLTFNCKKCGTSNTKYFSRFAFNEGIVIVTCGECKTDHLVADNLNWFPKVEEAVGAEGEIVRLSKTDVKESPDITC